MRIASRMVECRIPGHITGLYVFAVVNLCALLNISLVSADVYVIDTDKNSTIDVIRDKQAMFGPDFPEDGLVGRLVYVIPHNACESVDPPPLGEDNLPWIALISRGPCHFDKKVLEAQLSNYSAVIIHNYVDDDTLVQMAGGQYADKVRIPSVFVGYTDGMSLAYNYNYTRKAVLVKIEDHGDRPFTSYFWPFTVVVSVCFTGVVIFSIVKCITYLRHRHRSRLSKRALKRIPIRKYKKGDHYDTCAICLEDYEEGEKLRVLPCNHTYHCKCIDPWLTKRKKTCPQCKRRVIPGAETESESENDDEGASENTPLLRNNNNRQPGNSAQSRGRTSTFDRSAQPSVMVVSEDGSSVDNGANDDDTSASEDELEGAVGGVGISDQQGSLKDRNSVIVQVEPAIRSSPPEAMDDTTPLTADMDVAVEPDVDHYSPVRAEGSINGAFTSSSEEEATAGTPGRRNKKKERKNNQVV